jgi:sugar phosphate isomerase/epimerase
MMRILSTYLYVNQRLTPGVLAEIERVLGGSQPAGVEIFCARRHFDYRSAEEIRELADWFGDHRLKLHSVHAPTSREKSANRENAAPISIANPERVRRRDAVDEIKYALEVAEKIPFRVMVLHLGGREAMDGRQRDAAFSSLEHLVVFAKQRGVTLALENTPGEMATPSNLRHLIEDTRLHDLRLCFDVGHAHMGDGVEPSFEVMGEYVVTTHVHDNHGERDDHLLPYQGTVNWWAALRTLAQARPASPLPRVMELKEPPGVAAAKILEQVPGVFEKLERAQQELRPGREDKPSAA